jgi:hypothetical protein
MFLFFLPMADFGSQAMQRMSSRGESVFPYFLEKFSFVFFLFPKEISPCSRVVGNNYSGAPKIENIFGVYLSKLLCFSFIL